METPSGAEASASAIGILRTEIIGNATVYLGDCLNVLPSIGRVDHVICDPPYEAMLHKMKNSLRGRIRRDGGPDLQGLDFDCIDAIREPFVVTAAPICDGWFIAFCTPEGVAKWADVINSSTMKYKRACVWVKPDSTPQLNGQGPAQGAENFIVAWCGEGYSKWNAGGKRGVYTHLVNNPERSGLHPTEKPRRLMSEIIADFTAPGQVICEPFMGSGTTGVAAVMAGRRFIGIEREERYFNIACERIDAAQRQHALFPEVAA
jgi:site-specific DNA-methyltransferase (adenine-specific)